MRDTQKRKSMIHWIIGMILCPLGVCFSVKGGFGVSMIEAPVFVIYSYVSHYFSWFTFGTAEYIIQGLLMLSLFVIVRKFNWRYLLSFGTAVLYGLILDFWYGILGKAVYAGMAARLCSSVAGLLLTALAVAFFFRTTWPQEVWELFVKEICDRYHFNMTRTKWIYDSSSLLIAVLLMLILFHRFDFAMIGAGTILITIVNAPAIGLCGTLIDHVEAAGTGHGKKN